MTTCRLCYVCRRIRKARVTAFINYCFCLDASTRTRMKSSSSSTASQRSQRFLFKVILPAIRGQSCPICLKDFDGDYRRAAVIEVCLHAYCFDCIRKWSDLKRNCPLCNAYFDSWFCRISLSSRNFRTEKLPGLNQDKKVTPHRAGFGPTDRQRRIQRSRADLNIDNRRSRPLPWRRTFGLPGLVASHVIAERKLQWRASIYNGRTRAVPLSSRNFFDQNMSRDSCMKQRVLQRIEPWIRRELQAILEDPDPSVIVHVASSLFIASLEQNFDVHSGQHGVEGNFLAPLQPFLHIRTNTFWHELRCFAESSLTIETYDAVVEYKQAD